MIDRETIDQVSKVIAHTAELADVLLADMAHRDLYLHNWPASKFNVFAAVTQLLGTRPDQQLELVNAAMKDVGQVFASQGHRTARYGPGRRCATMDDQALLVMAQTSLEAARDEIAKSNLEPRRDETRRRLIYQNLFEYVVVVKLIEPVDLGQMMSRVNAAVAGVLKSGWLDRNVVKIRG